MAPVSAAVIAVPIAVVALLAQAAEVNATKLFGTSLNVITAVRGVLKSGTATIILLTHPLFSDGTVIAVSAAPKANNDSWLTILLRHMISSLIGLAIQLGGNVIEAFPPRSKVKLFNLFSLLL
jgi:hypothetical protein